MQVIVKGRNIDLTDALREHAEQKVGKLAKLDTGFLEVEVRLIVEKNPSIKDNQIAELTLVGKNQLLLRATDRDRDMYVAIDKAVSKMVRQIKKFHGKRVDRTHSPESTIRGKVPEEEVPEAEEPVMARSKRIVLTPMTPGEAATQMDMLEHDFFIFTDHETGEADVVYRRTDGTYGLIETAR